MHKTILTISELRAKASEVIKQTSRSRSPILITRNGHPEIVLQSARVFKRTQDTIALLKMLLLSQNDVIRGRVKPLHEAFKEIRKRIEVKRNKKSSGRGKLPARRNNSQATS